MLTKSRSVNACLIVAFGLIVVGNLLLLSSQRRLVAILEDYRERFELQVGDSLRELKGFDPTGAPLLFDYNGRQRTLMLIFTPQCGYCTKNWPNWTRLLPAAERANFRIIGIDLSGTAAAEYLGERGMGSIPVFGSLDYRTAQGYKLRSVPTTLLIAADGRVEQMWRGVLTATAMMALETGFSTDVSPKVGAAVDGR